MHFSGNGLFSFKMFVSDYHGYSFDNNKSSNKIPNEIENTHKKSQDNEPLEGIWLRLQCKCALQLHLCTTLLALFFLAWTVVKIMTKCLSVLFFLHANGLLQILPFLSKIDGIIMQHVNEWKDEGEQHCKRRGGGGEELDMNIANVWRHTKLAESEERKS